MLLCRRSELGLSLFFALIQASREHQTRDSITSFSESLELLHKKTYIEAAVIVYISVYTTFWAPARDNTQFISRDLLIVPILKLNSCKAVWV